MSASQSWGADSQGSGCGGPSPDERFPESGWWGDRSCRRSGALGLSLLSPGWELLLEARHHPPTPLPLRSHGSSWVICPLGFTSLAAGCRFWSGVFATTPCLPPAGACGLGQGCMFAELFLSVGAALVSQHRAVLAGLRSLMKTTENPMFVLCPWARLRCWFREHPEGPAPQPLEKSGGGLPAVGRLIMEKGILP